MACTMITYSWVVITIGFYLSLLRIIVYIT